MRHFFGSCVLGLVALGCGGEGHLAPGAKRFEWVAHAERAALLSVHGTGADDVWMSGADDGKGPLVLHYDGHAWERRDTGVRGDLWWVNAVPNGPVFFGGSNALCLRYQDGAFERIDTPGLAKYTVFGVWAAAPDDVYLVGSISGRNGFLWHYDGVSFADVRLLDALPEDDRHDTPGLFKVWGTSADDVWAVGAQNVVLRGNAASGFSLVQAGGSDTLFTVTANAGNVAIVGGSSAGVIYESDGGALSNVTPSSAPLLQGVSIGDDGTVWAVGYGGSVYRGRAGRFEPVDTGLDFGAAESLHSVWVDPTGGVWAAGGDVLTPALDQGLAWHLGAPVPEITVDPPATPPAVCPEAAVDPAPGGSMARRFMEQLVGAIRRDTPRPTVHARNLFHTSVAMWDAWAAYDDTAVGYVAREHDTAGDLDAARAEAVAYAAYRVLSHRYGNANGGAISQACFDALMAKLGYDPNALEVDGDTPRAVGNRIGAAVIASFAEDGANEADKYADPDGFEPDSPNLIVDDPGTNGVTEPLEWQRLVVVSPETQNGIRTASGPQTYVGAQWANVTPFALERPAEGGSYLDGSGAPSALDAALVDAAVELIRRSSELDTTDDTQIDISPGALGNNSLGTNDGAGWAQNPITHEPYAPELVPRSDFGRVVAEFWADGPNSETPPGHWNVLANTVADSPGFARCLWGRGDALDPLSWDVHVYLALNGALHDAAIAAWELKRKFVSARPITLIRYMAERGQRSDPSAASYDPEGLPLIPGLIELITPDSSAPGERHEKLARYAGEVAIRTWRGEPGDRKAQLGGVGWMRALEWIPYQRRTFVTPAFPAYISGHSTFSRAAATVLASLTGSDAFPGGLLAYHFEPGSLGFELGPSVPIDLEWATYFDAADQAGQSRLWGGIHITPDDLDGRRAGAKIGAQALDRAKRFYDGSARP